jgi:hypothetical protein
LARADETPDHTRPIQDVHSEAEDPTWDRLEDQIGWYDRKSGDNQRRYKWLKLLEIAVAASLPVVAAVHSPVWVTGGLAAVIVVLEGAQHLYQYQQNWISYRSTAEALKHERYLYLAPGGTLYRRRPAQAARGGLEGLVSQEHAKWTASRKSAGSSSQDHLSAPYSTTLASRRDTHDRHQRGWMS